MITPKWFTPFARRIRTLAVRAVVKLIDDAAKLQLLQVELLAGETRDQVERFQEYGFTSHPFPDAEAIALSVGGNRGHTVVIKVDDRRYRLKNMVEGEVALYTDEGDVIHFKRGNHIYIDAMNKVTVKAPEVDIIASTKVTIDSPTTHLTGALTVAGLITGQTGLAISGGSGATVQGDLNITAGDVNADGIGLKNHTHQENDVGGLTGVAQ